MSTGKRDTLDEMRGSEGADGGGNNEDEAIDIDVDIWAGDEFKGRRDVGGRVRGISGHRVVGSEDSDEDGRLRPPISD